MKWATAAKLLCNLPDQSQQAIKLDRWSKRIDHRRKLKRTLNPEGEIIVGGETIGRDGLTVPEVVKPKRPRKRKSLGRQGKRKMNNIEKLKVELFDIVEAQNHRQQILQRRDQLKAVRMKEMNALGGRS